MAIVLISRFLSEVALRCGHVPCRHTSLERWTSLAASVVVPPSYGWWLVLVAATPAFAAAAAVYGDADAAAVGGR